MRSLFLIFFIIGRFVIALAQITGGTVVTTGSSVMYSFNSGSLMVSPRWQFSYGRGSVTSQSQSGTNYTATIIWNSTGSETLVFLDGSTVKGSLNITIIAATPVATVASGISSTSFTANWGSVAGISSYRLDVADNSGFSPILSGYSNLTVSGATSKAVTGLTSNKRYYYRVRAVTSSGISSPNSNTISPITLSIAPVAKAATNKTSSSFTANWNAVPGITSYLLDVSTSSNFLSFVSGYNALAVSATTKNVTGLTSFKTYYYRVRAVNASGPSANSNAIIGLDVDCNYVKVVDILKSSVTDQTGINNATLGQRAITYSYFDGLGRPLQNVQMQASPSNHDIVTPVVYDDFGREQFKYLPYVPAEANGYFKPSPLMGTTNYANSPHGLYYANGTTDKVSDDTNPYSEVRYEASPLSRVLKQGAPGLAWQPDGSSYSTPTDMTIAHSYEVNASSTEVLLWSYVAPTPSLPLGLVNAGTSASPVYYGANKLYKNRMKDEAHNEVIEYIDSEGRTVLKRVQVVAGIPAINDTNYASTYYIYDDFGNLVCVIPPEATKRITQTTSEYLSKNDTDKDSFLKQWAFRYIYDSRNRMTQKQAPGSDPVYMVYDKRNRLVLTQDGVQRSLKQWLFTKYDALNRPVMTGLYAHGSVVDQSGMTSLISTTLFSEIYNGVAATHGYTNTVWPTSGTTVYTATYYDNYSFKSMPGGTTYDYLNTEITGQEPVEKKFVTGQITGTKINILGTATYLWSAVYYDEKYRAIQSVNGNHKGGTDRITNKYDFVRLVNTQTSHNNGTITRKTARRFDYDNAGRLLNTWHKFESEPEVLLVKNEYNEIGQLIAKKLHSRNSGTAFSQTVDYRYNIRGWIEKVNDPVAPEPSDLFSMQLNYNTPSANGGAPQYNGNISEIVWATAGYDKQSYGYSYDNLNRLSEAKYFNTVRTLQSGRFNERLGDGTPSRPGYDLNGNILNLLRYGKKDTGLFGLMDDLQYTYTGNQLTIVNDAIATGAAEEGFKELQETSAEYTYDVNGNMIMDKNKGITSILYNHLNLPIKVSRSASDYINYVYDAAGKKLYQQLYTGGTPQKTTDYLGEYTYENNTLHHISHEEGRIVADNSVGAPRPWEYQYFMKDHLGNVRATFSEKTTTTEYKATLETTTQTTEQSTFKNYSRNSFTLYNHTPVAGSTYSQLRTAANGSQIGLAKSFAVNPGDVADVEVYAKYEAPTATSANVNTLLTALGGAFALGTGTGAESAQAQIAFNGLFTGGGPWITSSKWEDGTAPKAYLNYILFDENFVLQDFGFDQISVAAKQVGATPVVPHDYLSLHVKVQKKGYLYIYLSNEQAVVTNVYFDDMKITYRSGVEQVNDYYPFGLTYNSYQKENGTKNNYLYNGKELQDELDLGWMDYGARMLNPTIGRWGNIDPYFDIYEDTSPYNYALNNPINVIDSDGQLVVYVNGFRVGAYEQYIEEQYKRSTSYGVPYEEASPPWVHAERFYSWDKYNYWSEFDLNFWNGKEKKRYVDGMYYPKSTGGDRFDRGRDEGKLLAEKIKSGEIKLENGETIKLVGHSHGGAHAMGIAQGLLDAGIDPGLIQVFLFAPHQPNQIPSVKVNVYQFSRQEDKVSSKGKFGSTFTVIDGAKFTKMPDGNDDHLGNHGIQTYTTEQVRQQNPSLYKWLIDQGIINEDGSLKNK